MRRGVRVGVDVGSVRIGVSRSDRDGLIATPVETVPRTPASRVDLDRILQIAAELQALEIVVGLPLSLSGAHTKSTTDAIAFARALAGSTATTVRLVDERLSTVSAHSAVHSSGKSVKATRQVIDQVAATIILQQALDIERSSGRLPGEPVTVKTDTVVDPDPVETDTVETDTDRPEGGLP